MLALSLLLAFISTLFGIYLMRPLAVRWGLVDVPDHRKHHQGDVPLIGGVAMFGGVALASLLLVTPSDSHWLWLLSALVIVVLGVLDDAKGLSAHLRLVAQALMTLILAIGSDLFLENFGNLLSFGAIHLGGLGYVVTMLAVIGAINAFNMMDGIDGLAGSMALVSFSNLAVLFAMSGDNYGLQVALIFLGVLLPYLANNLLLPPFKHKIFMGDAGSMLIGLSVVWLLIHGTQNAMPSFRPVTALWLVAVPLMDMAAIMLRRIRKGQSPFMADRDHLHHIFMRAGFSPRQALFVITLTTVLLAGCGIAGEWLQIPDVIMFTVFLLLFSIYTYALQHSWKLLKSIHSLESL
ncbi:MAG: UDP-N-acetylglucosamine--undecaprenyl-phosphate N-acetylglucosaminephosphotransferase [Thiothrix sp.]|uniref:UDP-N-acetylglucosamine--undecaprenyl-phosphate N-acetylglucosaminephosphotransferase n=1 Tax=Thiothrix sp. TaxID=1032 RepID=UPI00261E13F1|nr:UDP-N-acetylglucosamine--undecaprenyl-phosphate N-acetylglucosaminephosphotransferase [Thiothrix sp.]MDD5392907.1 UDP-N-acetylglucosamine--undecaprenyl-phosphate N-acetylglucosaminephosphotransferase [Thiothrix sp.]